MKKKITIINMFGVSGRGASCVQSENKIRLSKIRNKFVIRCELKPLRRFKLYFDAIGRSVTKSIVIQNYTRARKGEMVFVFVVSSLTCPCDLLVLVTCLVLSCLVLVLSCLVLPCIVKTCLVVSCLCSCFCCCLYI
jgi:hypothetical protein